MKERLIILAKNPVKGKVKTRLAATIGDEKALKIYTLLLEHTVKIASALNTEKNVYFTDYLEKGKEWKPFKKDIQIKGELGERMSHTFREAFDQGCSKVIIIGADCHELTTPILEKAFRELDSNDVVIGPAHDGGYYLLGMTRFHKSLFENKKWSTESVFIDTIEDITQLGLKHHSLQTLSDLDNENDLKSLQLVLIE